MTSGVDVSLYSLERGYRPVCPYRTEDGVMSRVRSQQLGCETMLTPTLRWPSSERTAHAANIKIHNERVGWAEPMRDGR
jgi:hypothetical protein